MPLDKTLGPSGWEVDPVSLVDSLSKSSRSIKLEHARIHEGNAFIQSGIHTIAAGADHYHLIDVGAGIYPHMRFMNASITGGPFSMQIFEGATVSSAGTPETAFNMNRNSSNLPGVAISYDPTITNAGTALPTVLIPGGRQTGGFGEFLEIEWILKPSTKYLLKMHNYSSQPEDASVLSFWYQ